MSEILIGYVKQFDFLSLDNAKELFSGHPFVGQVYRIVKDDTVYRLHLGAETNKAGFDGIFLGNTLDGNYDGKWSFKIDVLDKDNLLNYAESLTEEELQKVQKWLTKEGNEDLQKLLETQTPILTPLPEDLRTESSDELRPEDLTLPEDIQKIIDEETHRQDAFKALSKNLNVLVDKDPNFVIILSELISYLTSTYSDKYEADDRPNYGRIFLETSESSDVALFNSFKYLQRYSTKGFEKSQNIKDIYKAIHYCLFELQRRKNAKN